MSDIDLKSLARAMIDQLPRQGGDGIGKDRPAVFDVQVLALLVLLEGQDREREVSGATRVGLSISDIRRHLGLAVATTSDVVASAERAGLVVRTRSTFDHRIHLVSLTPKGWRMRRIRRGAGA